MRYFMVVAGALALMLACAGSVWAGPVATYPFAASAFVENPSGSFIYAAVPSSNSVQVIDANTLAVTNTVSIGVSPNVLTLSPDGGTLFAGGSSSTQIARVDTSTLSLLSPLTAPAGNFQSMQYGTNNRLWVLSGNNIHQINANTGASTGPDLTTGNGMYPLLVNDGGLQISGDRQSLYYGNTGYSPSNAYRYDVSGASGQEVWAYTGGGNGRTLALSNDGTKFVYHSAGDSGGISVRRTSDLAQLGLLSQPATSMTFSPNDKSIFSTFTYLRQIIQYDASNYNIVNSSITLPSDGQALFAAKNGTHLFVGESNGTEVYVVSDPPPPPPPPPPAVIYNTGVDSNQSRSPDGTIGDAHYQLVSIPNASQTSAIRVRNSNGGFPVGPWLGDNTTSSWIGPNNNAQVYGSPGNYDYRTTFEAPAGATSVTITGKWAADDAGLDILVNGVTSGNTTSSGFSAFTAFALTAVVAPGTNNLDFIVLNQNSNGDNPTGLRVEIQSVTFSPVPEPGTVTALAAGAVGLFLARRRR
jgi:YVTN family beta-propeller protein